MASANSDFKLMLISGTRLLALVCLLFDSGQFASGLRRRRRAVGLAMPFIPLPVESLIGAFLLAFPALFSIVNPIGAALIFYEVTAGRSESERRRTANRIALYALAVLLASLWLDGL